MIRLNVRPAPLSHVSVTGLPTPSDVASALQTVNWFGVLTLFASGTKPLSAQYGAGPPGGENNVMLGLFGSIVSR